MRYMTCVAAIMLMAFATTGCQTIGTSGCSDCAGSGMMTSPACGCDGNNGCASGNCATGGRSIGGPSCGCDTARSGSAGSGDGRGTLFGSLFNNSGGSRGCNNGSCGLGQNNGFGNGAGNRFGNGAGNCNGNCNGMGAGAGFSRNDLAGCQRCMGMGIPCPACLAPGGRLSHLAGVGQGLIGGARGLASAAVNRAFAHDCQTPHTIPYAQGGMGGPGMGGPTAQYSYPYYTTRAPRDFLMANPPSIGP